MVISMDAPAKIDSGNSVCDIPLSIHIKSIFIVNEVNVGIIDNIVDPIA